jgi:hypothetical protein
MQSTWLTYALITTLLWGVWGAFTGLPAAHGFPDTLIYVVWALTMIPPACWPCWRSGCPLSPRTPAPNPTPRCWTAWK